MDRSRRERPRPEREPAEHGAHTLRVWRGTVVGIDRRDVFVELGPRMQGVISIEKFEEPPRLGDEHEFTLRGQEEGLWVLALEEEQSLVSWERMEQGNLVEARVVRRAEGGLELKVGPLHAFMPRSHTGLARGEDPAKLVGKKLACEVLEVDRERQRVLVSRRLVLEREREDERARSISALRPGTVVEGRVTRLEAYGAFVRFGHGLTGLIHVSNLARERVAHAADVLRLGASVRARVLEVRERGRRIALGLKQMQENPWAGAAERYPPGRIVAGEVAHLLEQGCFVALEPGIEGFLPRSEAGLAEGRGLAEQLAVGQPLSLRVLAIDPERERLSLSLLHSHGARIAPSEAEGDASFRALRASDEPAPARFGTPLGSLLARALRENAG